MRSSLLLVGLLAIPQPLLAAETPPSPGTRPTPTATPAPAKAEALRNTLKWRTASELHNVGFDVYRGDSEEGPFHRLTGKPVPGAGTSDEPHEYVWHDEGIEAEKTYWYYVESISLNGERERFTPTFKAPVKHRPGSKGPSATPAPSPAPTPR